MGEQPGDGCVVDAMSAYDLTFNQIEIFSDGTGNAPFELRRPDIFHGLIAWREAIKAAMFLTTDNATSQVKLLLGPDRCLRLEPAGDEACVGIDDYDNAFARLPALAFRDFETNLESITRFFGQVVAARERHYAHPST